MSLARFCIYLLRASEGIFCRESSPCAFNLPGFYLIWAVLTINTMNIVSSKKRSYSHNKRSLKHPVLVCAFNLQIAPAIVPVANFFIQSKMVSLTCYWVSLIHQELHALQPLKCQADPKEVALISIPIIKPRLQLYMMEMRAHLVCHPSPLPSWLRSLNLIFKSLFDQNDVL